MEEIKLGRYQYYKGELYHVIGIARPEKDLYQKKCFLKILIQKERKFLILNILENKKSN